MPDSPSRTYKAQVGRFIGSQFAIARRLLQLGRGFLILLAQRAAGSAVGRLDRDLTQSPVIQQEATPLRGQFGDRFAGVIQARARTGRGYG